MNMITPPFPNQFPKKDFVLWPSKLNNSNLKLTDHKSTSSS